MTEYKILRPCLWFAKDDIITIEKLKEYYTEQAIRSLLQYGYIQVHKF